MTKKKERERERLVATQISVVKSQLTLMNDLTKHRHRRRRRRGKRPVLLFRDATSATLHLHLVPRARFDADVCSRLVTLTKIVQMRKKTPNARWKAALVALRDTRAALTTISKVIGATRRFGKRCIAALQAIFESLSK